MVDKVVLQYEKYVIDKAIGTQAMDDTSWFANKNESGAVRLVRTCCKCLSRGGDEKSGRYK